MTSTSILLLQGEEQPFELVLIDYFFIVVEMQTFKINNHTLSAISVMNVYFRFLLLKLCVKRYRICMILFPLTLISYTQPQKFANRLPKFVNKYSRAETRMSIMYNTLSIGMQCSNLIYAATTKCCVCHHK